MIRKLNIPAILFNYRLGNNTTLAVEFHGIIGQRNSVQWLANPNVADTVNATTKNFNARQVDRDYYYGFTTEARLLTQYHIGDMKKYV